MRVPYVVILLGLSGSIAVGQASIPTPAFDVASVRPSKQLVGPDYNNQLSYSAVGIVARNVTLKRLMAEAYQVQQNQVSGPSWLDKDEYDIDAKSEVSYTREQHAAMLRSLLSQRFKLTHHSETREMRVYDLVIGKSGPKIHSTNDGDSSAAGAGFHFHGDMRRFADLLAAQLSIPSSNNPAEPVRASTSPIPVLDKTGLPGVFDFSVDIHPELDTDMFAQWQRALEDQLGLKIESHKGNVTILVVDQAIKLPTDN